MYRSLLLTVHHNTLTDLSKFEYFVILPLRFVTAHFFKNDTTLCLFTYELPLYRLCDFLAKRTLQVETCFWYTRPQKYPLMLWYSLQIGTMSIQSACFNQPTNSYSPNQCLCFAVFYLHSQSLQNQSTHKRL